MTTYTNFLIMRKKMTIDHQLKDFQVARGEGLTGKQPAVKTNIIPHPMVLLFSLQFFIKTASICVLILMPNIRNPFWRFCFSCKP